MSPIYTKTGDDGSTGLLGNKRVNKSDLQIEVLGSLDELSAAIGFARSLNNPPINDSLKKIQVKIYEIMSEIAAIPDNVDKFRKIGEAEIDELEKMIEQNSLRTKVPNEFILPGDISASAALSVARTIARRAERRMVELSKKEKTLRKVLLQYLNRLSSFLYVLEIFVLQDMTGKSPSLAKKKG